jgi:hypothetical protein
MLNATDASTTPDEVGLYKTLFPPVKSAATIHEALQSAKAIAQLDELRDSDFLQVQFVQVLIEALGKPNGWPSPGDQDQEGMMARLQAALVLSEGARYCHDVQSVLQLTDPILGFSGLHGSGPIATRTREVHAQTLAGCSVLAVNTREATELANRIGRPDHYLRSEFLQLQIGRCLLAAASVEERPETLSRIELLFEKLPSQIPPLQEMRAEMATMAGRRALSAQEQRAHALARASWATEPFHDVLYFAKAVREMPRYHDSRSIQTSHALAIFGGIRDLRLVGASDLRDTTEHLMGNPEFWRDRSIQSSYLQVWDSLWRGPAQVTYDGLCAGRHFDSDVLYDSSYEVVESPLKKVLIGALKLYRNEPRALLRDQADEWLRDRTS